MPLKGLVIAASPPLPLSGAGLKPEKFAFLTPEFAFLTSNCSRNDKFFQFISFLI